MKCMVVQAPKQIVFEERPKPEPGPGEVRIKVAACGVCFSDHLVTDALWPGLELPRVPGHEIAGEVDALGSGVQGFARGDRVGVGWHGGHDRSCVRCAQGQFSFCVNAAITGISRDGGYSQFAIAPWEALARVPNGMELREAAPLLCAGVTTFNALRNAGARPGDLVGIQGLGGLGHLGVQFARAMGFRVAAISRGSAKQADALKLGAHHYLDAGASDPAALLQELGGAKVVLATAPSAKAISALVGGLGVGGTLMIVGAPFEALSISALDLIGANRRVQGWASGTAQDSTDTMEFAKAHGIKTVAEYYPLASAPAALEATLRGKARFRSVLEM